MSNLEWALACAARGWLVFPSREKKPLVRWSTASTLSPDSIAKYWEMWPDADVCIKTGADSNLVVVDWDGYKGGPDEPLGPWPETYTAVTSKGGYHFYFTHPGFAVANSAGALADYVDVRGDGGMVVAYSPLYDRPLLPVPEPWVTERRKEIDYSISLTPANPFKPGAKWAEHLLAAALADIRFAKEGKRNFTLYAAASDCYRLVWAGALDHEATTQALGDEAVAAGLDPHEVAATLVSAMRNGATQYEKGAK